MELQRVYRTILNHMNEAVYVCDHDMNLLYINPASELLTGWSLPEALGRKCYEVFGDEDLTCREVCPVSSAVSQDIHLMHHEGKLRTRSGDVRDMQVSISPIFEDKAAIGAVIVMEDITHLREVEKTRVETLVALEREIDERKLAEEELRLSEQKYRDVVENVNDAIFVLQEDSIVFYNKSNRVQEVTGYTIEDLDGIPFIDLIHPEDKKTILERYERRLKGEAVPGPYSFRIKRKDGKERWLEANAVPIKWEGRPAVLYFFRDTTEQRRLGAQLRQAQKMEAVGTLAGGIAHDFNNLLHAIQGYAQLLLLDKDQSDREHKSLQQIVRAARRGSDLTLQLLALSRKAESKLRPTDLSQEVKRESRLLERTLPKMVKIEVRPAKEPAIVNADPGQMEQVLMNLAVNARDAMPDGGKLVLETEKVSLDEEYCRTHFGARAGDYVLLTVSDTGRGIEEDILEHIYEPFFTTKEVGEGTGLGLAMVYGIVKSHDGFIVCHSEPGEGTAFKVYIPAVEQETELTELVETEIPLKGGTETILLVDDEDPIRDFGEELLTRFGYTVFTASDGESALALYTQKKQEIDLVLLDLSMPGMGGRRCLEKLLEMAHQIKVVIASGYAADVSAKEAIEAGARAFTAKPFDMSQMLRIVREVLDED